MLEDVGDLLWEAADQIVLPLFRKLDEADVSEKAPGEVVTVADRRAEALISARLRQLLPGSMVVGEEAVADDPGLLRHLSGGGDVWLVDPVDGTANFAAGKRPFALMVALLTDGRLTAGWILDPLAKTLAVGRADDGTLLNGHPAGGAGQVPPMGELRGAAMTRFLPPETRDRARAGGERLGELLPGQHCAGREYLDILTGEQQFALFWRTLPWDHAPGTLLVRAAGGVARRFDGTDYDPAGDGRGLLVAANDEVWTEVRDALLGS
jgi:fructose-1,6-bisphosphatase/inositol monophosphatase family enzyme